MQNPYKNVHFLTGAIVNDRIICARFNFAALRAAKLNIKIKVVYYNMVRVSKPIRTAFCEKNNESMRLHNMFLMLKTEFFGLLTLKP